MSRRIELDALRGMLLVTMALTHLPTRLHGYSDQALGFVSAAEGFVFLSAFVAGNSYRPLVQQRGARYVRERLWSRAASVYGHHLGLLAFTFTVVATLAAVSGRPGLKNLLAFYFDSPGVALLGGPLLLYQPPLLDILPMYTVLLALTPAVLERGALRGWRTLGLCSLGVWCFAQLGGRALLHQLLCALTGLRVPLEATGSFDLLAWQLLWLGGLFVGFQHGRRGGLALPRPLVLAAGLVALCFFVWRHRIAGLGLDLAPHWLDKWKLGTLRLVNFATLAVVISHVLLPALRRVRVGVLALLGRASLKVFVVHLVACLVSLALVIDDQTPLSSLEEAAVLLVTLGSMLLVAWRSAQRTLTPLSPASVREA